jgi:hypothetical protein
MNIAGPLLFFVGILIAISGSAKMPAEGATYPDTMGIFFVGAALAIIGTVLWRITVAKKASEQLEQSNETDALSLLRNLMAPAQQLREDIQGLDNNAMCERVDQLLNDFILPFADNRQQVINRLGMDTGAELLVTMAYGERMLNRTWSAASDGYPAEALAVFPDAVEAFEEAVKILDRPE